ncbi:hypothetical protein POUND7_008680 [Theobroma cacao]
MPCINNNHVDDEHGWHTGCIHDTSSSSSSSYWEYKWEVNTWGLVIIWLPNMGECISWLSLDAGFLHSFSFSNWLAEFIYYLSSAAAVPPLALVKSEQAVNELNSNFWLSPLVDSCCTACHSKILIPSLSSSAVIHMLIGGTARAFSTTFAVL